MAECQNKLFSGHTGALNAALFEPRKNNGFEKISYIYIEERNGAPAIIRSPMQIKRILRTTLDEQRAIVQVPHRKLTHPQALIMYPKTGHRTRCPVFIYVPG